jgi:hypothetical protein
VAKVQQRAVEPLMEIDRKKRYVYFLDDFGSMCFGGCSVWTDPHILAACYITPTFSDIIDKNNLKKFKEIYTCMLCSPNCIPIGY